VQALHLMLLQVLLLELPMFLVSSLFLDYFFGDDLS
jgi:hypothetical protein